MLFKWRALALVPALLVTVSILAACGADDESAGSDGSGSGGRATGGSSSGGTSSGTADCGANPEPADSCTGNGTCSTAGNCFCLSNSVSCSDGPPPGNGGTSSGNGGTSSGGGGTSSGGVVDCGDSPESGDECNSVGLCDSDPDCFCDGDEVRSCSGDIADCGDDPQEDDSCSGGPGVCDGSQTCWCNSSDEVRCF